MNIVNSLKKKINKKKINLVDSYTKSNSRIGASFSYFKNTWYELKTRNTPVSQNQVFNWAGESKPQVPVTSNI